MKSPLKHVLDSGESDKVEFIRAPSKPDSIGRTVCAFLNARGGCLILGAAHDGQVAGIRKAQELVDRIERDLTLKISPKTAWSVNVDQVDGKDLIVLHIPEGAEKPYVYGDRVFVRREATTLVAKGPDITSLINQRNSRGTRWERQPALGYQVNDLDAREIRLTAMEIQESGLKRLENLRNPTSVLEQLNLLSHGMILNSAVALFGRNPTRRFPQMQVRVARFETQTSFSDIKTFEGHTFSVMDKVQEHLRLHIPIHAELPKNGLKRSDTSAYPWAVIREALVNAIVHRDYAAFDGGLSVAIHDDRMEFWNSGCLPEGMTVEMLRGLHPSRPSNPDIANVFFLRRLIERWGIGTRLIVDQCREAGLPEPSWSVDGNGVTLVLRLRRASLGELGELDLNPRQATLVRDLKDGDRITPREYFSSVAESIKERRARTDLVELTNRGYLRREGRGPSTTYVRTKKRVR